MKCTLSTLKLGSFFLLVAMLVASAAAFSLSLDRRNFLGTAATASLIVASSPSVASADDGAAADADADGFITTESGMKYKVLKEGSGAIPEPGMTVKVRTWDTPRIFLRSVSLRSL